MISCNAVDVNYGFNDNVEACDGDNVTITWYGYHDIIETTGSDCNSADLVEVKPYQDSGTQLTFSNNELTASPGERRYFKCSQHCGFTFNRFEVFCPAPVEVNFGFDANVQACVGDSVNVTWWGYHNIQETAGSDCNSASAGLGEIQPYQDRGTQITYSNNELSASPGERRYFKCSSHCGIGASRFEVFCPAAVDMSSMPTVAETSPPTASPPKVDMSSMPTVAETSPPTASPPKVKDPKPKKKKGKKKRKKRKRKKKKKKKSV